MALIQSLYDFFGIELLSQSSTFVDLINNVLLIGLGLWITCYIIKCLFMACTIPNTKFY